MAEITRDELAHLATLARIDLTDAELDHLAPQLGVILESVASISAVAADDVPAQTHALPLTNVFREDVARPGLTAQEALSGAPVPPEQQRFSVPRIGRPATRSRSTTVASYGGTHPSRIREPHVVGSPLVASTSLTAIGTPSRTEAGAPAERR